MYPNGLINGMLLRNTTISNNYFVSAQNFKLYSNASVILSLHSGFLGLYNVTVNHNTVENSRSISLFYFATRDVVTVSDSFFRLQQLWKLLRRNFHDRLREHKRYGLTLHKQQCARGRRFVLHERWFGHLNHKKRLYKQQCLCEGRRNFSLLEFGGRLKHVSAEFSGGGSVHL